MWIAYTLFYVGHWFCRILRPFFILYPFLTYYLSQGGYVLTHVHFLIGLLAGIHKIYWTLGRRMGLSPEQILLIFGPVPDTEKDPFFFTFFDIARFLFFTFSLISQWITHTQIARKQKVKACALLSVIPACSAFVVLPLSCIFIPVQAQWQRWKTGVIQPNLLCCYFYQSSICRVFHFWYYVSQMNVKSLWRAKPTKWRI